METNETGDKMGNNINKKGQTPAGVVLTVVILFGLAIAGLVTFFIMKESMTAIIEVPQINQSLGAADALQAAIDINENWDYIILFAFIATAIGLIILGYFIDVHTVFLPFYIIALIIGVVLSGVLSYVWENVYSISTFSTVTGNFPITNHLMTNLMIYFTIMGVLSMIATYAKVRSQDGF